MQGRTSGFGGVEGSESMSESEDMVWDTAGECLDFELANPLDMVEVMGME